MEGIPLNPTTGCGTYSFDVIPTCDWRPSAPSIVTCGPLTAFDPDLYMPPDLPVCSIPPFTTPTIMPREPEVIFPDIMLPDDCNCITCIPGPLPALPSGVTGPTRRRFASRFTMHLQRVTVDCCALGGGGIEFDGGIPCLPLEVRAGGNIVRSSVDRLAFNAAMVEDAYNCRLSMDLQIQLAGMGITGPTGPIGPTGCPACYGSGSDTLTVSDDSPGSGTATYVYLGPEMFNDCWTIGETVCVSGKAGSITYRATAIIAGIGGGVPILFLSQLTWLDKSPGSVMLSTEVEICHGPCAAPGCDACIGDTSSQANQFGGVEAWSFSITGFKGDNYPRCWHNGDKVCISGLDDNSDVCVGTGTITATPSWESGNIWKFYIGSITWEGRNPDGTTLTGAVMCHGTGTPAITGPSGPTGPAGGRGTSGHTGTWHGRISGSRWIDVVRNGDDYDILHSCALFVSQPQHNGPLIYDIAPSYVRYVGRTAGNKIAFQFFKNRLHWECGHLCKNSECNLAGDVIEIGNLNPDDYAPQVIQVLDVGGTPIKLEVMGKIIP